MTSLSPQCMTSHAPPINTNKQQQEDGISSSKKGKRKILFFFNEKYGHLCVCV